MQFDQIVENGSRLPHRVSRHFCEKGCLLRAHSEEFIRGKPLQDVPDLEVAFARLSMIVVTERSIEAKHAVGKKASIHACNMTESYYSLGLRMEEIRHHLKSDRLFLAELAECLQLTRRGGAAILDVLHLSSHPAARDFRVQHGDGAVISAGLARKIVYRCDIETQHADTRVAKKTLTSKGKALQLMDPHSVDVDLRGKTDFEIEPLCLHKWATEFLQLWGDLNTYYSCVSFGSVHPCLTSFARSVAPRVTKVALQSVAGHSLALGDLDVESEDLLNEQPYVATSSGFDASCNPVHFPTLKHLQPTVDYPHTFFSFVHLKPSSQKRVDHLPDLHPHHMSIQPYKLVGFGSDPPRLAIQSDMSPTCSLSLFALPKGLTLSDLRGTLIQWQRAPGYYLANSSLLIADFTAEDNIVLHDIVKDMVGKGAFADSRNTQPSVQHILTTNDAQHDIKDCCLERLFGLSLVARGVNVPDGSRLLINYGWGSTGGEPKVSCKPTHSPT